MLGSAGLFGVSPAGGKGAAPAASKKGAAWVDYEAPDGLYKARFPGAPQAETQKGVPTRVVARYETLGGLDSGVMYYVAAMVGKTQNTPPTDLLPGLLAAAEKQGFQPLGTARAHDHARPRPRADLLVGLFVASRRGEFAAVDPTLSRLLGRPPRSIREILATRIARQSGGSV